MRKKSDKVKKRKQKKKNDQKFPSCGRNTSLSEGGV